MVYSLRPRIGPLNIKRLSDLASYSTRTVGSLQPGKVKPPIKPRTDFIQTRDLKPSQFQPKQRHLLSSYAARTGVSAPQPRKAKPPDTVPYSIKTRADFLQTSKDLNPTPFQATQRFLWIQKTPYIPPSLTPPPPPAPTPPPAGVIHDATLSGDGVNTPLSVVKLGFTHTIGINETGGTTITEIPAPFDGSADTAIDGFEVTALDGGAY